MYVDMYRTCMFGALRWLKTHPSCALLRGTKPNPNSTPTSRFCISKFLKRSRWSFTMKTFQLYRQHWWQWPKPGPFGSKTSLIAMGAVVDGLKIIFLKTSPMWLASWWVLMGKKVIISTLLNFLQASPRQVTWFHPSNKLHIQLVTPAISPNQEFCGFWVFPELPFPKNRQANHESISWGPHHKTSNKQSTVAFLEAYNNALKPENHISS